MKYVLSALCVFLAGYVAYLSDQLDRRDRIVAAYDEAVARTYDSWEREASEKNQCLDRLLGRDL